MPRKKVFIGWNGENKLIAEKISAQLYKADFDPIVGGEDDDATMFVGTTIIDQMNRSEMAILLFEQLPPEKGGGVSANVMFEWGYLLHKLSDPKNIRIYLMNMDSSHLPSDVSGCWSCQIDKPHSETPEQKDLVFNDIAIEISDSFISYASNGHFICNKLDYFDNWDENKHVILNYNGASRISYKLIFGMQISIYSGKSAVLHKKLSQIRDQSMGNDSLTQVLNCAMNILEVFISTNNLTHPMSEDQFLELAESLQTMELEAIHDQDLAAWCRIFREDKLELCYEFAANNLPDEDKLDALQNAVAQCEMILGMIAEQVARNPEDAHYALLYQAFAHRNMHLVSQRLLEMEELDIHRDNIKLHRRESLKCREALYQHYRQYRKRSSVTMDYITQEYLLGLAEQYEYEEDPIRKRQMRTAIRSIRRQVQEQNEVRNMIYHRIEEALSGIPGL